MPLLKTKGPKFGKCNICAEPAKLSEDHVPPKGVIRFPRMQLYNIASSLNAEAAAKQRGRQFQQGVKFRSLCRRCNGDLLGGKYDPHLINLCNDVSQYMASQVYLPSEARFATKPDRVIRAIFGHLLAIGVEQFPRGDLGDAMAEAVLNPDSSIPSGIGVYYWPYPFWDQVSIRGFGFLLKWGTPPLIASVIKFMPLAFMVMWKPDQRFVIPHLDMMQYVREPGSEADIPLDLSVVPPQRYPEAPDEKGATLHGDGSYYARPHR